MRETSKGRREWKSKDLLVKPDWWTMMTKDCDYRQTPEGSSSDRSGNPKWQQHQEEDWILPDWERKEEVGNEKPRTGRSCIQEEIQAQVFQSLLRSASPGLQNRNKTHEFSRWAHHCTVVMGARAVTPTLGEWLQQLSGTMLEIIRMSPRNSWVTATAPQALRPQVEDLSL